MVIRIQVIASLWTLLFCQGTLAGTIVTVPVGSPNNSGNPLRERLGAVSYEYRVGAYEVTNAQYVEFLNAKDPTGANRLQLYNPFMSTDASGGIVAAPSNPKGQRFKVKEGRGSNPVVFISWYDAVRFANWVNNGQGEADTEDGAYTLLGGTAVPQNSDVILRNPAAKWFLPNDNEWYKAGFYNAIENRYYDYATASDVPPTSASPSSGLMNSANLRDGLSGDSYALTGDAVFRDDLNYLSDVGAYIKSPGPFGTFDQAGNAYEWSESQDSKSHTVWGGSFRSFNNDPGGDSDGVLSQLERNYIGFRIATVPEPTMPVLMYLSMPIMARYRKRR
ncbi:MAG: SUMF1/EgtB/PvdO family nonheme iron enzyme [Pirellulales bacterium]